MNARLYVIRHEIEGEQFISPCVGEDELAVHARMAEHLGARLLEISDLEFEITRFVWTCCLEGEVKGWAYYPE